MHPPFSAIFLTTLIGAGQGLFLVLFGTELLAPVPLPSNAHGFLALGSALALLVTGAGLVASFFHLGQPQRAWRGMTQWRTSWLAREGIALPLFMALLFAYGLMHFLGWSGTAWVGAAAALVCLALFLCTGMIYVSIRFLQEWASPLTLINYLLLGCASGASLAVLYAIVAGANGLINAYAVVAITLAALAAVTRTASLVRNARLRPKSSLQSAIGIKHPRIVQKAQGFMGGSYNTREYFHGKSGSLLGSVKWLFLLLCFVLPMMLLVWGLNTQSLVLAGMAFPLQYLGLLAERWFFFAQANHPQNLYYQTIS
jgi:DMSO reductase anchor subunit